MPRLLPALVAEALGVFALSFIGILAISHTGGGLISVAFAHGLILAIMITALGPTSGGHFNPAVTIALLVGGKIKAPAAVGYIIAQLVGGLAAGLMILAIYTDDGVRYVVGGTPAIPLVGGELKHMAVQAFSGCIAELIATFFLVIAVWGTAVDPRTPKIGGFGIGLTVTADILAIGLLTGAAMNPARRFGPALAATFAGGKIDWASHWIYWVGPIAGGIVATLLYKGLFYPRNQP